MQRPVTTTIVTAIAFLALDAAWLTWSGSRLYRPAIGHLMASTVDWPAAAMFYAVYIAGLLGFAVAPARGRRAALLRGALFGFVAYSTYDLTCQATMNGWPWTVTLVDLAWGTFASAAASAAGAGARDR